MPRKEKKTKKQETDAKWNCTVRLILYSRNGKYEGKEELRRDILGCVRSQRRQN